MKKIVVIAIVLIFVTGGFFYVLNTSSHQSNSSSSLADSSNDGSLLGSSLSTKYDSRKVVVTSIGRFRWKLSVEYEIQDEDGKVLGSDVLIIEVNPNETSADLFGFLESFLKQRAAVWLLAQGKYTLREMSHDRLNRSHFQKPDNGDDVDDGYKLARTSRKQILDSVTPQDLPVFSITATEAANLQKPEYDELDRNKKPTGRKLRRNETFQVGNEIIGAGTEILRPNGNGDSNAWAGSWSDIDDVTPDDGTTKINNDPGLGGMTRSGNTYGYFALQDTSLTTETINSLDVTGRGQCNPELEAGRIGVRRAGSNSFSGWYGFCSWTTATATSISRPGGESWIIGDLNSLQAAADGTWAWEGTEEYATWFEWTQIYITVNYTDLTPTPTPTPVGSMNFSGGMNFTGKMNFSSN